MRVAVFGLGKLGLPLAAVLASKGHHVVGVDVNEATVELFNQGWAAVDEPGLQDLVTANRERLSGSTDPAAAAEADLSVVLVPTPSDETGGFSNRHVLAAVEGIGGSLAGRADYHVVVIGSTVMPGSCDDEIRAALEEASGRRVGETLGLCYSPEFIALGSVIRDLLEPDMVLIGESDVRAGDLFERVSASVCENDPPFRRMGLIDAELTKIAVNTYVTMKISFANTLAELCERLPGADVQTVTDALGLDSRIGQKYLRGAVAYGGPCFPRDNKAFAALARKVGVEPLLAEATDAVNRSQLGHLLQRTREHVRSGDTVGVLGLAYKPATTVVEESVGVALAELLAEAGLEVHVYDPVATPGALRVLGDAVHACESVDELLARSDVVVITTPWPEFRELPLAAARNGTRPRIVIDCWRILSDGVGQDAVEIVHLGKGSGSRARL